MTSAACSVDRCESDGVRKGMCVKHYQADWYQRNAERCRERQRQWRADNREHHRKSVKEWRRNNPEKARAASKRADRSPAGRERHRRYRQRHPEVIRRYNSTPAARDRQRLNKLKRRTGALDSTTRQFVLVLLRDPCAYCGKRGGEWDHIVALNDGGANDWTNLTGSCRSCNARKHTKTLLEVLLDGCC